MTTTMMDMDMMMSRREDVLWEEWNEREDQKWKDFWVSVDEWKEPKGWEEKEQEESWVPEEREEECSREEWREEWELFGDIEKEEGKEEEVKEEEEDLEDDEEGEEQEEEGEEEDDEEEESFPDEEEQSESDSVKESDAEVEEPDGKEEDHEEEDDEEEKDEGLSNDIAAAKNKPTFHKVIRGFVLFALLVIFTPPAEMETNGIASMICSNTTTNSSVIIGFSRLDDNDISNYDKAPAMVPALSIVTSVRGPFITRASTTWVLLEISNDLAESTIPLSIVTSARGPFVTPAALMLV